MFNFATDKNNRRKMESEWDHGYFLRESPGSTEYFIGTSDDVYSCATMRRLEEDKAFDTAVVKELDMHYGDYVIQGARSSLVEVRLPITGTLSADPKGDQPVPRRAKLNPGDLERHGYTIGCPGCGL